MVFERQLYDGGTAEGATTTYRSATTTPKKNHLPPKLQPPPLNRSRLPRVSCKNPKQQRPPVGRSSTFDKKNRGKWRETLQYLAGNGCTLLTSGWLASCSSHPPITSKGTFFDLFPPFRPFDPRRALR